MKNKTTHFIVVYDDGDLIRMPMQWNLEYKGAIHGLDDGNVAIFTTRAKARKAISISKRLAALHKESDKPYCGDFLEDIKNVKILPCAELP